MHFGVAFAAKPYGRKTPPRVDETFEELPAEPLRAVSSRVESGGVLPKALEI
jgi:hypothetical protein